MIKRFALILALCVCPFIGYAATGTISPSPFLLVLDTNGDPVNAACIWTYVAGTSTPIATYTDVLLSVANSNPIIASPAGRFTAFLTPGSSYKFVYEQACTPPAHSAVILTADNISATPASSSNLDLLGTAGEAITAGQPVYLSDGSNSKNAGQWYKADASHDYSSSRAIVGIAPSAISSGIAGTIRLGGQATGLTGLTIGLGYYVSTTAGAVTTTAPTLPKFLGVADTTSTLAMGVAPTMQASAIDNALEDFGLSLTTAVCHTTADVTAATSVFVTPCKGNRIALYDANGNPTIYTSPEISVAVPSTTVTMYDVFVVPSSSGAPTAEALAWTNVTTRATAIVNTVAPGVWTKSGDPTRRYVGSFETTGVSGQTEDSVTKRFVYSHYNRVPRLVQKFDTTASWAYDTATWRQWRATAANEVEVVIGVAEVLIDLHLKGAVGTDGNAATGVVSAIGIGEDSTTVPTNPSPKGAMNQITNSAVYNPITTGLSKYPAVGYHFYSMMEIGGGSGGVTNWFSGSTTNQSGLWGYVQ